jgi:hypothetical protein
MSWAAVAGAAVSVGGALLSQKKAPAAVQTTPVNLQEQQAAAVAGNQSNEGNIEGLLTQANSFTQQSAIDLMNKAVPGYTQFAGNLMNAGAKKLADPYALPTGVQDNLNRISAEQGITRGTAGQTNQYSALRDLGQNMLQYGQQNFQDAISALTTVTGTAPRVSPMSPMSFYVTPQQNAQVAAANNQNFQATAQGANNAQTAASNANNQNLWDSISKGTGQVLPLLTGGGQTQIQKDSAANLANSTD